MEGGRICDADEFPSTVKIFISIQDESGTEVAVGLCTGTVVDPKLVLTDSHCFHKDPLGYFTPVPRDITTHYKEKKGKLVTKYQVEGRTAKHAVSLTTSRQGVLVFDEPFDIAPTEISSDTPIEKGRVCQMVGFSPYDRVPAPNEDLATETKPQRTPEEFLAKAKATRSLLTKTPRRCGQTAYSGQPISAESDLALFEGISSGYASATAGDSGGGCYIKENGKWKLIGILEFGEVKSYVDAKGQMRHEFDSTKNPHNNGIVLFNSPWGKNAEALLTLARKIRDEGAGEYHISESPRTHY